LAAEVNQALKLLRALSLACEKPKYWGFSSTDGPWTYMAGAEVLLETCWSWNIHPKILCMKDATF